MKIGDKALDTKYERIVRVDKGILDASAREGLEKRWIAVAEVKGKLVPVVDTEEALPEVEAPKVANDEPSATEALAAKAAPEVNSEQVAGSLDTNSADSPFGVPEAPEAPKKRGKRIKKD